MRKLAVVTGAREKVRAGSLAPGHTFVSNGCLWMVVWEDNGGVVRVAKLEGDFRISNVLPEQLVEPIDCQVTMLR